jgi:hypothetical protein
VDHRNGFSVGKFRDATCDGQAADLLQIRGRDRQRVFLQNFTESFKKK